MADKSMESLSISTTRDKQSHLPEHTLATKTFSGFRSPGLLAKWPILGLAMFLLGSLTFAALAQNVSTNETLIQWDLAATKRLHIDALSLPSALVEYVIFGFFVGREIIIIIGTILTFYFLHKRFWPELAMVLVGMGGGPLIWYVLSRYFDRPRPTTQVDIILSDPSFPSGHTLSAVLCYGLMAYLIVPKMPSRFWKWLVILTLTFVTAFVGISRLLLGGHYVTDVIAGFAVGLAWGGLVYTLLERLFWASPIKNQQTSLLSSPHQGLRSPGLFGRWPMIGFILVLLGGLSFAAIGYDLLHQGPLSQLDVSFYKELLAKARTAPPRVNEIMIFGFFIGKQVILVMDTILSIYFVYQRFWRELGMLLISSAGGSVVWWFFSVSFARPRPPEQLAMVTTSIPSFPSGHSMSLVIFFGLLAYLLVPKMPSLFWKWSLIIATVLIVLFAGFSRLFEGNHYLTDVLSGYALGITWAGLVYTLIEGFFENRIRNVKKR